MRDKTSGPRRNASRHEAFTLGRLEWTIVVVVALAIIIVNKVVIGDHGNTWPSLIVVSVAIGMALVWTTRWGSRRAARRNH